jgi:hypothetical protein
MRARPRTRGPAAPRTKRPHHAPIGPASAPAREATANSRPEVRPAARRPPARRTHQESCEQRGRHAAETTHPAVRHAAGEAPRSPAAARARPAHPPGSRDHTPPARHAAVKHHAAPAAAGPAHRSHQRSDGPDAPPAARRPPARRTHQEAETTRPPARHVAVKHHAAPAAAGPALCAPTSKAAALQRRLPPGDQHRVPPGAPQRRGPPGPALGSSSGSPRRPGAGPALRTHGRSEADRSCSRRPQPVFHVEHPGGQNRGRLAGWPVRRG